MNFLQKLQSKSKKTKKKIMWLATGVSMVLVIAIWLLSFPKTFTLEENPDNQEPGQPKLPSFEEIKNNIKDLKNELQDIEIPEIPEPEIIDAPQLIEPDDYYEPEKIPMQLPLE